MSWGLHVLTKMSDIRPEHHPGPPTNIHVHDFSAYSTVALSHVHIIAGTTDPAAGGLDCHTHLYRGTSSVTNGHFHNFAGKTSAAVPLTGGGHGHWFKGPTSVDALHRHCYNWFTGPQLLTTPHDDPQEDHVTPIENTQ